MTPKPPLKDKVRCLIRKNQVSVTPEERVRQALLGHLIYELNFPPSLITVEKPIQKLAGSKTPKRRLDVLCFAKDKRQLLRPLLLIECKAHALNKAHLLQVLGYNFYVEAPFVAVVGPKEILFQAKDDLFKSYLFIPDYKDLCQAIREISNS